MNGRIRDSESDVLSLQNELFLNHRNCGGRRVNEQYSMLVDESGGCLATTLITTTKKLRLSIYNLVVVGSICELRLISTSVVELTALRPEERDDADTPTPPLFIRLSTYTPPPTPTSHTWVSPTTVFYGAACGSTTPIGPGPTTFGILFCPPNRAYRHCVASNSTQTSSPT